ncbi:MAG TPA: hypothetical protein VGQ09_23885 [Chitinophagaceae bacterium]|nr:hypothetical protein [Chitinophagaceae bacterium]
MKCRITNIIKALKASCMILGFVLSQSCWSQDQSNIYTIKNGKMYILLNKKITNAELDKFIAQYDLHQLGLKRFILSGNADSIKLAGWKINSNNASSFSLIKPLLSSNDLNNPAERIIFTSKDRQLDAMFPSVSNKVTFGYNRFRNKQTFTIQNSNVTFFLRNNLKANKVMLAGSFNRWNPDALSMKKTDSGWIAIVKLSPGKYWYKFIVDGNWTVDNDNRLSENDGLGNVNSVYYYTNTVFLLKGFTNAKKVFLAGSFNNWKDNELVMEKTQNGWELPLYLANGTHRYRFIVDRQWMADPGNSLRLPNEYHDYNSFIAIGEPYLFKLNGYTNASRVVLSGSFNNWRTDELFMKKTASGWELPYVLGPGNYEYKFIVDGRSTVDPSNPPSTINEKNNSNLVLDPNFTFRLKGYETASTVFLAGDFNDWSPTSMKMKKENGGWIFTAHLSPGKHLYKFIVDGKWIIDPANKLWEQNEYGSGNSVLWIEK